MRPVRYYPTPPHPTKVIKASTRTAGKAVGRVRIKMCEMLRAVSGGVSKNNNKQIPPKSTCSRIRIGILQNSWKICEILQAAKTHLLLNPFEMPRCHMFNRVSPASLVPDPVVPDHAPGAPVIGQQRVLEAPERQGSPQMFPETLRPKDPQQKSQTSPLKHHPAPSVDQKTTGLKVAQKKI